MPILALEAKDAIKGFLQGNDTFAGNYRVQYGDLWHYGTCIAIKYDGAVIVNETRYSATTDKLVNGLIAALEQNDTPFVVVTIDRVRASGTATNRNAQPYDLADAYIVQHLHQKPEEYYAGRAAFFAMLKADVDPVAVRAAINGPDQSAE